MARMHARRKGKSGSTHPVNRKKHPEWSSLNPREIESHILDLAKVGKSTSEIGMVLRDQYAVPDIKIATGKKVSKILDENNILSEFPEDIKNLITLRNELVHYKMGFKQPSCVKDLQQRKIALAEAGYVWTHNISSLEGMRWAHNTICATIQELGSFATQITHPVMVQLAGHSFYEPWSESFIKMKAKEVLAKRDK